MDARVPDGLNDPAVLQALVASIAGETGLGFFRAFVRDLARALDVLGAWITEYDPRADVLRARAMWLGGRFVDTYEHAVTGTPCEPVIRGGELVQFPDNVFELFGGGDPDVRRLGVVSYIGHPLHDLDGRVVGHLAAMDTRPMADDERLRGLFRLFAVRAMAELRRLEAEDALRRREEQLARLVDGAKDAILEVDGELRVTQANPAARALFARPPQELLGATLPALLTPASAQALRAHLEGRPLAEPLQVLRPRPGAPPVPAEASLARTAQEGRTWHTVILRDLSERQEAERTIRRLTDRAAYLEEELELQAGELLGRSPAMGALLADVAQVAGTDATVLILGETGTGKELVAREVHRRSARAARPLVKVNCAALPRDLIESELFGHEAGAFTGALKRRDGRFTLADGGTIFLDEVGELPLEVQAKLLRVLQEGELEPLGSSVTRKVDARVIAATHRDLPAEVAAGRFRQDLYYRLNVVPVRVPALRERREDVGLLAQAFLARSARRLGKRLAPLPAASVELLARQDWPGNVRELQHVLERAAVLARGEEVEVERCLSPARSSPAASAPGDPPEILTAEELRALEATNLQRALERAGGRIAGAGGAAELLGIPPSTFASRLKALGVRR